MPHPQDASFPCMQEIKSWQMTQRELPTMEDLMKTTEQLATAKKKGGLLGLAHGLKIATGVTKHAPDALSAADSGLVDTLDWADCFGLPVCTTVVQSLRWGALAYAGHIEASTAVCRVALSVVMVGSGAGIGAIVGTAIFPGLGTLVGGALGGLFGGRTSKAIIYQPFTDARSSYLTEKDSFPTRVAADRQRRNALLEKSAIRSNAEYKNHADALLPTGNPPNDADHNAAVKTLLAKQISLTTNYTAEFTLQLTDYAQVVSAGIHGLNVRYDELTAAMKRLGIQMPK